MYCTLYTVQFITDWPLIIFHSSQQNEFLWNQSSRALQAASDALQGWRIENWSTKKQEGLLQNCKFSNFMSEFLSGGTSWRNKLVNCGDKIQVGTVTVKPLYFIGLNDQCSPCRWYSCITSLPQIDSIYWPIPPLKKQLQSSKHLGKW